MKLFSLIVLTIMAFSFTSCGGKDGGSKSTSINQLQAGQAYVKDGFYNTTTQALEIDGVTYPPSQAYTQVMNQAIQQAQAQGIQPIQVGQYWKFRARISGISTGAMYGYNQSSPYNTGYNQYNQGYNPYGQQQLQLTSVQFYR